MITDPELIRRMIREELGRNVIGLTPGAYNWGTVDAAGRVLYAQDVTGGGGAHFYKTGTQAIANNTFTPVNWDDLLYASGVADWSSPPHEVEIVTTGYYLLIAQVEWGSNASGRRVIEIHKNFDTADVLLAQSRAAPSLSGSTAHVAMTVVQLAAGAILEVQVQQTSGGSLNIQSGAGFTDFSIELLRV